MDIRVRKGQELEPAGPYNKVVCDGSTKVKGSLIATEVICKGTLEVKGALKAQKVKARGLRARDIDVDELHVGFLDAGNVRSVMVQVSGKVAVRNLLYMKRGEIEGSVICSTLEAEDLSVKGSVRAIKMKARRLRVKGSLEVDEGNVDEVEIGGSAKLGDCSIGSLVVGGTLRIVGDAEVGSGEASMVEIKGNMRGGILRVREVLKVDGTLDMRELYVGGAVKARGHLKAKEVRVSGKSTGKLSGKKITVTGEVVEVEGKDVELLNARAGKVVGKMIRIRDSDVGEVRAQEVEVLGRSKVDTIAAERVYVAGGHVRRIFYTEKLLISPEATVEKERKVEGI